MNMQPDINHPDLLHSYTKWTYPTDQLYGAMSSTGESSWPEIIEPCEERLSEECPDSSGCALIAGVVGLGPGKSSYRLRGFYGTNKLKLGVPTNTTSSTKEFGDSVYHYYWFSINDTVADADAKFEYQLSVQTKDGANPDLVVSLMDGRFPTLEDNDLASTMMGADTVTVSSEDTLWDERGWSTQAGVVVVAGVKLSTATEPYQLILTSAKTAPSSMERIDIGQSKEITLDALPGEPGPDGQLVPKEDRGYSKVFQLYNWEHKNSFITFEVREGSATIMCQTAGQKDYSDTIYSAIPYSRANSLLYEEVTGPSAASLPIPGDACYGCWYFIKVKVDTTDKTVYRITVSQEDENVSGQFREVAPARPSQRFIAAGAAERLKFILNSMDNFSIDTRVVAGTIEILVGTDPVAISQPGENYFWKASSDGGRVATIHVKTTDKNFHLGTYYYIYIRGVADEVSIIEFHLKQQKMVEFIPNNHDFTFRLKHPYFNFASLFQKFQYQSASEQVKFHVFQVPGAAQNPNTVTSNFFKVRILISALTPHFYPVLYLKKQEFATQPGELSTLKYPTLIDYDLAFGENPFSQLQQNTFTYEFKGIAQDQWVYYSLAVYQQNWGLTDHRKSEYQIRIEADMVDKCEVIPCSPQVGTPSPAALAEQSQSQEIDQIEKE